MPYLLFLELINVAARRWAWPPDRLIEMVTGLLAARFGMGQPPLERVAYWAGRGLTAYDACYVALAEERRTVVITADERILTVAGSWQSHSRALPHDWLSIAERTDSAIRLRSCSGAPKRATR